MHIKLIAATMIAALLWAGGTMVAPAITEPKVAEPVGTEAPLPQATHTIREAEAAALAHAGFTPAQVTRLHTEVDYENGKKEFEVEFRSANWEYDYTVSAETLEILKHQKEYDPPKQVPPAQTQPAETAPAPAVAQEVRELTAEEAQAVALTHAGFTADQVTGLRTEIDYENGVKEYEVDFRSGDWEYDYTVAAADGKLLKSDKEYDPPKQPKAPAQTAPAETKPAETKKISASEAKSIALAHAGLTADQVKGLRAEYDRDDGRPEYDVEFRVGRTEYEYEIHAETGKILSWDKEIDD